MDSIRMTELNQASSAAKPMHGLVQYVEALLEAVAKGVNREIEAHGLTRIDFEMLNRFWTNEEWTATELAKILPVEVSAISRIVTKLVDLGLISRRRSRRDRRVVFLRLTDAGRALIDDLRRSVLAYEETLTEGISEPEVETFYSVIDRILANYDSIHNSQQDNAAS